MSSSDLYFNNNNNNNSSTSSWRFEDDNDKDEDGYSYSRSGGGGDWSSSYSSSQQQQQDAEHEDVTRLHFSRLSLYGRTTECQILQAAYHRAATAAGSFEKCLVHGYSGTGKSTLIAAAFAAAAAAPPQRKQQQAATTTTTTRASGCFFATGKFDQLRGGSSSSSATTTTNRPYSALSAAIQELCTLILESEHATELQSAAVKAVGPTGAAVLRNAMPTATRQFFSLSSSSEEEEDKKNVLVLSSDDSRPITSTKTKSSKGNNKNITTTTTTTTTTDTLGNKESLQQLKFVFRAFLRSVCTASHPVVLFFDDLQWIDSASLELLTALMRDKEIKYMLFIGAYRENEVSDVHPLMMAMRNQWNVTVTTTTTSAAAKSNDKKKNSSNSNSGRDEEQDDNDDETNEMMQENANNNGTIHKIKLGNLDQDSINQLVLDLLKVDKSLTEPLVEIIYRRTQGNVFFVLEFIKMLHQKNLLYYSTATYQWEWDDDKIVEATNATDNVVDLVVENFQKKLSEPVKDLLKIASCLANSFHSLVLWQIVGEHHNANNDSLSSIQSVSSGTFSTTTLALSVSVGNLADLEKLLDLAMNEGIIEKGRRKHWYRFSHDKFQQGAYALLDDAEERQALHYQIGRILLPKLAGQEDESWRTFIAVDQLNKGSACVEGEEARVRLARLNLRAGEMASSMSAFVPAMEYFSAGVKFLPEEGRWEKQYNLCLDLYSCCAEVAYVNGDFEETDRMCDEVLKNAKGGLDKMRAVFTRVDSLGAQQKPDECLKLSFDILRTTLGEPFPRKINLFHVIGSLIKTHSMIRGMSDGELLSLPVMTEQAKIAAMKLLTTISTQAYWLHKPEMMALVNFRMLQLSVKYGVARLSPAAFARYGLLVCALKGDIKDGYRFGKLATTLVDRLDAREWEAQVIAVANQFLFHWEEPLQNLLEPLLKGYQVGHERGDVEFALLCAGGYSLTYFHSGLKLGPMVKDLGGFCNQMKEYGQFTSLYATLPYWQGVLNLMGRSADPLRLTGEAMDEDELLRLATETNNAASLQNLWYFRAVLAYFLGELEEAFLYAKKFRKTSETAKSHVIFPTFIFYSGLIHLALARKKKKRTYFVGARKDMNMLKKWVKEGAVNSYHKLLLLNAEYKAVRRGNRWEAVKKEFEKALNSAARAGFLQDRAIAHQLLGEYFISEGIDTEAQFHISRAHSYYKEWGANAVANHLHSTHLDILSTEASTRTSTPGTGFMARSRFSSLSNSWNTRSSKSELLSSSLTRSIDRSSLVQDGPGNRNRGSDRSLLSTEKESGYIAQGLKDAGSGDILDVLPEIHIPVDQRSNHSREI